MDSMDSRLAYTKTVETNCGRSCTGRHTFMVEGVVQICEGPKAREDNE